MEEESRKLKLHAPEKRDSKASSPLPDLIQTPSGLALVELQGTINLPQAQTSPDAETATSEQNPGGLQQKEALEIGRIEFPDYVPDTEGTAWMKRVHMYIGQHQRLTGEVKKLPKAFAVVKKRDNKILEGSGGTYEEPGENLQVVDIVKYKLMFSNRPEPVGTENAS